MYSGKYVPYLQNKKFYNFYNPINNGNNKNNNEIKQSKNTKQAGCNVMPLKKTKAKSLENNPDYIIDNVRNDINSPNKAKNVLSKLATNIKNDNNHLTSQLENISLSVLGDSRLGDSSGSGHLPGNEKTNKVIDDLLNNISDDDNQENTNKDTRKNTNTKALPQNKEIESSFSKSPSIYPESELMEN